jgi:hypothetical protein
MPAVAMVRLTEFDLVIIDTAGLYIALIDEELKKCIAVGRRAGRSRSLARMDARPTNAPTGAAFARFR